MNKKFADTVLRMMLIFVFVMGTVWMPNTSAGAQDPNPFFIVRINENLIESFNWTKGVPITLTIDDPSTSEPADYTQTITFPLEYSNKFRFNLDNFIIQPGFIVTMTDGTIIRTHTILNLKVDGVDTETDTVFGKAEPAIFVHVFACDESGCGNVGAVRHVFSDENGNWVADFYHPGFGGDEQSLFDIKAGKRGEAFQSEYGDVNSTSWSWNVPNPGISVTPAGIWGIQWLVGTSVTLTVDDPVNGTDVDYTATEIVQMYDFPNPTAVFQLPSNLQILPGFELTMTDGNLIKSYTVIYLKILNIDANNDVVSGVADAGEDVWVWMEGGERTVTAGSDGIWMADFSVSGSLPGEENTFDILPYTFVMAFVNDGNNNGTTDWVEAMNPPVFMLNVNNASSWQGIDAWNWPLGSDVTLTVDDPNTIQNPDYTEVQTMGQPNDGGHTSHAMFLLDKNFEGHPGFIITLNDGIQTKTMIVPLLAVTGYGIVNDTITGVSDPFTIIQVPISHTYGPDRAEPTVVADSEGKWQADLAGTFDIQPGDYVEPQIYDTDGDHIVLRDWRVPKYGATFWFFPEINSLESGNWPLNEPIHLLSDDPSTPQNPDYDYVVYAQPADPGRGVETWLNLTLPSEHIIVRPGFTLTISGGEQSRSYLISSVNITSVDITADTIEGYSEPASLVVVNVDETRALRRVIADQNGYWLVDFSIPGDKSDEFITDIKPGFGGLASVWNDGDLGATAWLWTAPNPFIIVQLEEDRVFVSGWSIGTLLQVEIDDPTTPQIPDYSDSLLVIGSGDRENGLNLNGVFDIQPGHLVTVSGDGLTKQLAVAPLTVTAVDIDADTVSGTGDPGFEIHVGMLCDDNSCTKRNIYVDANGNWLADFSVPGINEEETVFDIRPGSGTGVYEIDEDADATNVSWSIPNPYFNVRANNEQIEAWEWNIGSTLTVNIYSSGTEISLPDYTISDAVTGPTPWGDTRNYLSFNLNGIYDIKPGYLVTISDGTISKQHIVKPLAFDVMDVDADTVSGFSELGSNVNVWACDNSNCYNRHVTASDPGGIWIADWHIPGLQGDENNTLDLVRGTWVDSSQYDDDGDSTMFGQSIPNPFIEASPADNWIHAREWPIGTLITMNINGSSEIYTAIMGPAPWNPYDPNDIVADFDLQGYDIQAGDVITASGNGMTKTLTVSQLAITDFDLNADTLSGVATPEVQIQVCANVPDRCIIRWITADDSGNWLANYQVPGTGNDDPDTFDIQPDSNGWVSERDEDRDQTWINWNIPNPTFGARPNEESVELWQWPLGATVTIEIDDPATPQINPDFTGTAIASIPSWNPNETRFTLNFSGQYDLKPGDLVTVTEGNTIKTHTVTGFQITNINIDADIVSGVTDTGGSVDLWICGNNGCVNRNELVDQNGEWSANFAVPGDEDGEQGTFDIKPGIGGDSAQWDEDGDGTVIGWRVPNPIISARPFERQITGYDWPDGALITMTIDVPLTTASPDYTATSTAQMQYFGQTEATFNLIDLFNLKAGDIVAMTDGVTIKTHMVTNLEIQSVDVDTDQVFGMADPGHTIQIFVWASQDNSTAWRDVTADSNGSWVADFSISMDGMTYDVLAETWGETIEYDEDGDNTNVYWRAPNPNITVYPDDEIIEGNDWPLDSVLTVQIGNPDQPDYTTTTTLNPPDQDHTLPWFRLDLSSVYDLQPGEMVTAFDAETTKQLIVVNRNITLIDMVTDTITGTWDQNITFVVLWACDDNGCAVRREEVTTDVNWSVNFALPGELNWENILLDIQSGTTGGIYQNDEDGDGTSYTWSLNQPPQADLGPDLVTDEGSTLMLDASASSDPESDLMTYAWDLDNDGEYDDAVGVTTSKSFPDNGAYVIGLKVTDQYGESDTDTAQINVVNVAPLVDIQDALANNLGVLSGNGAFTDPGADTWTATVNYGDGTGIQSLAFNPDKTFPLSHTYIANGNYTVEVCVSDDDSASGCDQTQVTVTLNRPPVAKAGGPYVGYEGTSITLNASRSTDPNQNIVLYEWDLDNDGLFDDATGARPKFTAIDNGIFTVRVRVTDAGGLSSEDSSTVTVKNVPPVITSLTFNSSVRVGVKLNTYATFKDVGINDTFTATCKWGDGTTSAGAISGKTVNGSHTYTKPGIYLVTIMVKDKDGGVGQAYKLIFVLPKR